MRSWACRRSEVSRVGRRRFSERREKNDSISRMVSHELVTDGSSSPTHGDKKAVLWSIDALNISGSRPTGKALVSSGTILPRTKLKSTVGRRKHWLHPRMMMDERRVRDILLMRP